MTENTRTEQLLAAAADELTPRASSRLKSRIYSRLALAQAADGPLLSLPDTKAAGQRLCVFEELVCLAPLGEAIQSKNPCRVCHARVAAENIESAPIYWPHCPYVRFQNR